MSTEKIKQVPSAIIVNISQFFWGSSYYGMFGLLVAYFNKHLNISEAETMMILGAFGALGPILSALGGLFCDRFFGAKRGILLGYMLYILSYISLAYAALEYSQILSLLALSLTAFARGLSNTGPRTLIAKSYGSNQNVAMDSSFTYNYMLNNLGSFTARISFPILLVIISYQGAFLLSGILMVINVLILIFFKKHLISIGSDADFKPLTLKVIGAFLLALGGLVALINLSFNYLDITKNVVYVLAVAVFGFFIFEMTKSTVSEKKKMLVVLILLLQTLLFFLFYNLLYTAVIFYAINTMDTNFFGFSINPLVTQSFNPFWIIIVSPILAYIFSALEKNNKNPTIFTKFAIGLLFSSMAFLVLFISGLFPMENGRIASFWFLIAHFFQATAELLISALGVSALVRLTPKRSTGFVVGLQLVTLSVTSVFSAVLSQQVALPKGEHTMAEILGVYSPFFAYMSIIAFVGVIITLLLVPVCKKIVNSAEE